MKLRANELRIGNVLEVCGNWWHVNSIIVEKADVNDFELYFLQNDMYDHVYNAKPVPLDEGWLKAFGFVKDSPYTYQGKYIAIEELSKGLFTDRKNGIVLKYVHQFQNLYFALTGEELVVEE